MSKPVLKTLLGQYDSVLYDSVLGVGGMPFFPAISKKYGRNESYIVGALLGKLNEFLIDHKNYDDFQGLTAIELEDLSGLSAYSRRIAIKVLKAAGLIKETRINRVAYYTANINALYKLLYEEDK